jgi:Rab-like protein 3
MIFYQQGYNGIMLIHDLTNKKSHENLKDWLLEVTNKDTREYFRGMVTVLLINFFFK